MYGHAVRFLRAASFLEMPARRSSPRLGFLIPSSSSSPSSFSTVRLRGRIRGRGRGRVSGCAKL